MSDKKWNKESAGPHKPIESRQQTRTFPLVPSTRDIEVEYILQPLDQDVSLYSHET